MANKKLTLAELNERIGAHDNEALSATVKELPAYVAKIDAIMAEGGWTEREYEDALYEALRLKMGAKA